MNKGLRKLRTRWLAVPPLAVAVLAAGGYVFEAASRGERPKRVLVLVDTAGQRERALVARATAATRRADRAPGVEAQLRVTRTPTEQLSVTHLFAASGYDVVVGAGLDRRIAVAPVTARFPDTRFVLADERTLSAAVGSAAR